MEKIYFATKNGDLIDNLEIARMARIVDGEHINSEDLTSIRSYASMCKGVKKEISNPSVKYLIKNGHKVMAIKIYYEKHKELGLVECRRVIEGMEKAMKAEA